MLVRTSDDVTAMPRDRSRRPPVAPHPRRFMSRIRGGGTDGNEQLTTVTGIILIVLLAVIGVTIPDLRQLISVHLFVGLLLLGPVALKMVSTGYRFVRYYTGDPEYRRKGPPEVILRLIGPLVVLATVGVFATGIALLIVGPNQRNPWLLLHKATFIVWLVFMGLHVLGHLPAVGGALGMGRKDDEQLAGAAPGAIGRWIAITGAVVAGLILALLLIPDFSAWTAQGVFHHHHHFGQG